MIEELKKRIAEEEGRKATLYKDSEGFWTIGIGRLLDPAKGGRLREAEIDYLFENDVSAAHSALMSRLPWISSLDDVRVGALINMAFQMGPGGVVAFTSMLEALRTGNWQKAHDEALSSLWAKQTPARAERAAKELLTGEWQWLSTGKA